MARRVLAACVVGFALFAASAASFAGTHADEQRGFSFDVPEAWEPMPAERLDEMNERVESAYRGSRLVAAYVRSTDDPQSPYFVVQVTQAHLAGLDYDEVAEKLDIEPTRDAADRAQVQGANNISRMQMRRAALDRDNNRFVFQGPAGAPPMANLVRSSVGFLAGDGVVTLHCYAKARDAETVRPVFDSVIASFRFDAGVAYAGPPKSMGFTGLLLRIFVIGGLLVAALWFVKDRMASVAPAATRGRRRDPHRLFAQRYRLR